MELDDWTLDWNVGMTRRMKILHSLHAMYLGEIALQRCIDLKAFDDKCMMRH